MLRILSFTDCKSILHKGSLTDTSSSSFYVIYGDSDIFFINWKVGIPFAYYK